VRRAVFVIVVLLGASIAAIGCAGTGPLATDTGPSSLVDRQAMGIVLDVSLGSMNFDKYNNLSFVVNIEKMSVGGTDIALVSNTATAGQDGAFMVETKRYGKIKAVLKDMPKGDVEVWLTDSQKEADL
jgi:hypothetical protein